MFTFDERLGIFFTIEGACLSAASVTFILGFALYKWIRRTWSTWGATEERPSDASDSSLFLNLMLADLLQAIGNLPNIVWMSDAEITEGSLCTAQAVLKQIGIVGVAMTSLAIAVHTFSILVLRWKAPRHISKYVVLGVWIFTALVIGIPNAIHRNEKYYGPTGYWCWIVPEFKTEQIVTEYLWVWIAGFSMAILYTIMFLVIRGWFIIDNGIHWHKTYEPVQEGAWEPETEEDKETKLIANSMLFYPAVYIFCVFPNSLARWLYFSKFDIPYQFTLFASTLYALSGMLNLILFFITRRDVVVGPNVTVEAPNTTHRRNDSTGHAPQKLGRLPDRTYNDVKQDIEMQGQPNANARLLESHHLIYHSPPPLSAQLSAHPNTLNHLSADHEDAYSRKHSRASSSVTEDQEDYGHLPG